MGVLRIMRVDRESMTISVNLEPKLPMVIVQNILEEILWECVDINEGVTFVNYPAGTSIPIHYMAVRESYGKGVSFDITTDPAYRNLVREFLDWIVNRYKEFGDGYTMWLFYNRLMSIPPDMLYKWPWGPK